MQTTHQRYEELIVRIERAFRRVERPQITLRVARGIDDHRWGELEELHKLDDHYRDWLEVPEADIAFFKNVFIWFCPVGFRFYLPAYMISSLRSSRRLIDELWLQYAFGDAPFHPENIEILDAAQKQAVREFLEAAFECIQDDYHRDWWNHPWDAEWKEDAEKEHFWQMFGRAFTFLRSHMVD